VDVFQSIFYLKNILKYFFFNFLKIIFNISKSKRSKNKN